MTKEAGQHNKPQKENLKQRAYLNSVTSVLDYGARVLTTFFVTPFLVSGLGSTLFGVWKVLGQFTSYTGLADIKATQVLKWAIAKDRDSVDKEELREYITATFLLVMLVLPLVLIAGAVITWYSPHITNAPADYHSIVRMATAVLVLALVVNKVFDIFESILRGMNLGFKRMGFRAGVFVAGGGLQIAVVLMGYGLIALALIQVLVNLVIGITIYVIVKRHVPWFGWGKVNFKKSLSFFKTSGWFMGGTFNQMILNNSDKMILGYFAGPAIVTQYVITEYLIKAVKGIIGNVVHGVKPGLGKLYGNKEYDKYLKARKFIFLLVWLLVVPIGSVILLFNESFVGLWINADEFAGQWVNLLLVVMAAQFMFIQLDTSFISMTLNIQKKVGIEFVSAIISLLLAVLLTEKYGIVGLCIAFISGRFVMTIAYPLIVYQLVNESFSLRQIPFKYICITLIVWGGILFLQDYFIVESWFYLILIVMIILSAMTFLLYSIVLDKKQKKEIIKYFYSINLLKNE